MVLKMCRQSPAPIIMTVLFPNGESTDKMESKHQKNELTKNSEQRNTLIQYNMYKILITTPDSSKDG